MDVVYFNDRGNSVAYIEWMLCTFMIEEIV